MNQNERRCWLIHALLEEMPQYQYPVFPFTADRQWQLLRGLMNVRPPMPASEEFLRIQDAFLKEMTEEKGITDYQLNPERIEKTNHDYAGVIVKKIDMGEY